MKHGGSRRKRLSLQSIFVVFVICAAGVGLLLTMAMLILRSVDTPKSDVDIFHRKENSVDYTRVLGDTDMDMETETETETTTEAETETDKETETETKTKTGSTSKQQCATVEEMGEDFKGSVWEESLRVRKLIQRHLDLNGTTTSAITFFANFVIYILILHRCLLSAI